MGMHEECLESNFRSIEILKEANLKQAAHPRVAQIVNDDEDEDDDNDENIIGASNSSNMDVDIPKSESDMNSVNRPVNGTLPKVAAEADDEWTVVSNRRNKGRKN
ncbi:uncharacterized protein LOC130730928 [Lotus japonicus]|uniref:uncharacterized protein LOC130730928 n=1 Tax=Lotus japonicus TaxID=34305 RepID=UPI0025849B81|nr:uncharacterized protein LOC130730928 [Lotus japonicus]